MKHIRTDVAVIGAGTAGLAAYRAAKAKGKRAVIIEGTTYGTTCARVGCMPSKLLIAAAEAAHSVERFAEFGLELKGELKVDGRAVMARVKRERDRFVGFVLNGVDGIEVADKLWGRARFTGPRELVVGDDVSVKFASAVIATGSSPVIPPVLRGLGERVIVNDDIFNWDDLPRRVAVIGPGVIGLELGQALSRLGVEVTMFGREGHLGPFSDPAVREYATRTFQSEFRLDTHASIERVSRTEAGFEIAWRDAQGAVRVSDVEYIIAATGRSPNLKGLGPEATGIALAANGVPLFDRETLRCGESHIFIAGDANDDVPLLHEAADEGRIAGENAATLPQVVKGLRRAPLGVVFSDPQIATVGARYADLAGKDIVIGEVSFEDQGRSRVMLRNEGLLHVYADRASGEFLGAEMVGPDAEHIAHLLAWARQSRLTIAEMLERTFYHPVVEEGLRTALRDAQAKLEAAREVRKAA